MPIIKLGWPKQFSHLKYWTSEFPTLRTTGLIHGSTYRTIHRVIKNQIVNLLSLLLLLQLQPAQQNLILFTKRQINSANLRSCYFFLFAKQILLKLEISFWL